jgi:hypothetical protein
MAKARKKNTPKIYKNLLEVPAKHFKRKREPATPEQEAELAKAWREFWERAFWCGNFNVTHWGDEAGTERIYLVPRASVVERPKPGPLLDKPSELPPRQEAIRKIRNAYPDGVPPGTSVATVCRKIGLKWDTTKRALLALGWQPPEK